MHSALSGSHDFQAWQGTNANAICDAIIALVDMPLTLRLMNWLDFARRMPGEAPGLQSLFSEMTEKYPTLASTVIFN